MTKSGARVGRENSTSLVQISTSRGRIRLRWRANGERYSWWPGLNETQEELIVAQQLASQLSLAIYQGNVDEVLTELKSYRKGNGESVRTESSNL